MQHSLTKIVTRLLLSLILIREKDIGGREKVRIKRVSNKIVARNINSC